MTQAWDFVTAWILWQDPEHPAKVEALSLDILDVPVRARGAFRSLGVTTIGELIACTENQLLRAPNFGRTSLRIVRAQLEKHGVKMKTPLPW